MSKCEQLLHEARQDIARLLEENGKLSALEHTVRDMRAMLEKVEAERDAYKRVVDASMVGLECWREQHDDGSYHCARCYWPIWPRHMADCDLKPWADALEALNE